MDVKAQAVATKVQMQVPAPDSSLTCKQCGKAFASSRALMSHEQSHAAVSGDDGVHVCNDCGGRVFGDAESLAQHRRAKHNSNNNTSSSNTAAAAAAASNHSGVTVGPLGEGVETKGLGACEVCDWQYTSQRDLASHMTLFDPQARASDTKEVVGNGDVLSCALCVPPRAFVNARALSQHAQQRHGAGEGDTRAVVQLGEGQRVSRNRHKRIKRELAAKQGQDRK